MGLHADRAMGFLYSIGEDTRFRTTDIAAHTVVCDLQPGSAGLKAMLHNESRGVFFIADGDGWVYIYSHVHPPELLCKIQTPEKSCIRGLCLSTGGSYLVAGASDGVLSIFELGRPKGERFTKLITSY